MSPDGRTLLFAQMDSLTEDLMLVENFSRRSGRSRDASISFDIHELPQHVLGSTSRLLRTPHWIDTITAVFAWRRGRVPSEHA